MSTFSANKGAITRAMNQLHRVVREGIRAGSAEGLELAGETLLGEVQRLISGPPGSRPGQPPGLRTGRLRSSYDYVVIRGEEPQLIFGSDLDYAAFLEIGTSRMAPRPHVRPATRAVRDKMSKAIAFAIERKQRSLA